MILNTLRTGLLSFCIIFIFSASVLLEASEFKLGSKTDYNNKTTDVVYGNKNASYITKTSGGYALVTNGRKSDTYKDISMLSYGESKDSYAYIGIDSKGGQNIVHNGKKIRHTMDKIVSLSVSDKSFVYIGKKDDEYLMYLNSKKISEFKEEVLSVMLLENGSYLMSVKDDNSHKILFNTKEIARSQQPVEFYKHGKYIVIVHADNKSTNGKSISITDNYKKLENFEMTTFEGFNRIGSFYKSANEKSYVLVAYKTSSENATIIANGKIGADVTKLNKVVFSPNGLRYLLDVKKSNGSYVIGDDDEFGPYGDSIVDMAFSTDSLLWGFLGRTGITTVLIIDSDAITGYRYANNMSLSKSGNPWSLIASNGGKHFLHLYDAKTKQPTTMHEASKIYAMEMSNSTKRIGFIYDDGEGNTRINININDEILEYKGSSKYPFIVVTDKNYMSIVEHEDKYSLMLNGKSIAKFDEVYELNHYSEETSGMQLTYLNDNNVYLYTTTVQ